MAGAADIDRLIEEGLNRYGGGDLDGALLAWEQVLTLDPENAQANSYVDYVRLNYELLQNEGEIGVADDDLDGGFGIADEPDYIIEIQPGEPGFAPSPAPAPMYMDPLDEGWFIEEETRDLTNEIQTERGPALDAARTISADLPPQTTLEIEADEPPDPADLELPQPVARHDDGVSFESSTREYGRENEFADEPSSFKAESTPLGFGSMETEVRKRELGFVQPTHGSAHLEIHVRTPKPVPDPSGSDMELGGAGRHSEEQTHPERTMRGMAPVTRTPSIGESIGDDDTVALPQSRTIMPRRSSTGAPPDEPRDTHDNITPPGDLGLAPTGEQPRIITRDLPGEKRPPAGHRDEVEDIALPTASTRDLKDERNPTHPDVNKLGLATDDPLVATAPTRELGLRPGGRPPSVYPDEDAPTRQSDARAIREHNTQQIKTNVKRKVSPDDGTAHDIVLPFDPISARAAHILDDLDADMPPNESKEDRTRRRITTLLERALAWNNEHEVDNAVTAVDLALSEDPNSALAQKLIHRNRETIMAVFQEYLGDLERQPQLSRPLHELSTTQISPRAAFLLSRIDGHLTTDEILDVSGMPRLEAYRHLCQLFLRGILR